VKSLKTGKGSIVESDEDLNRALHDMKTYRGIIEGGIILREVVALQPHSEIRYFVAHNKIFGPHEHLAHLSLLEKVIEKLSAQNLKFYSIDIATTNDSNHIIIEIGDGQVSEAVNWPFESFMNVLIHLKNG
jgi:hypothetical protein